MPPVPIKRLIVFTGTSDHLDRARANREDAERVYRNAERARDAAWAALTAPEQEAMLSTFDAGGSLSQPPETVPALSFYDHHRQSYRHLPIREAAEFMVGDYGDSAGGGEFAITLMALGHRRELSPHLEVFGDAVGSLQAAIAAGLLDQLAPVADRDEFSRRLLGIGFRDTSKFPIGSRCS